MFYLHLGEVHRLVADVVSLSLHGSVVLDGVEEGSGNILKTWFSDLSQNYTQNWTCSKICGSVMHSNNTRTGRF